MQRARPSRIALLLAFFVIYVVWGSTYLAIRYAVETIPPLLVVAIRQGVAGSAIFAWVYWRGYRPTLREWRSSLVLGILYFVISHGALHWAETIVPSGLTALLIASEPIWIAILSALVLREERVTGKTIAGLVLGIVGVGLLMRAEPGAGHGRMLLGCIVVVISAIAWSCGVIYSRNPALPKDPVARAGMAAVTGSGLLFVASLVSGEIARAHVAIIQRAIGLGAVVFDCLRHDCRLHHVYVAAGSLLADPGFDAHVCQSDHRGLVGMVAGGRDPEFAGDFGRSGDLDGGVPDQQRDR